MHSPDLNSLHHSDLSLEQIGHEALNVDVMSDFSAHHGLNLNHQDCQTHNYQTDGGMNVDADLQHLSYTSMAESSFPSLEPQAAMNLDYGNHDVSYTSMAESSFPSLEPQAATNLDYGNHDVSYTNLAESSFHSVDSFSAMPRSSTPNYEDAAYHEGHEKFNHEMAQSWASGGYFDKAAEYEKTAGYHHDKIGESLGS
jgi:hypothetical protein